MRIYMCNSSKAAYENHKNNLYLSLIVLFCLKVSVQTSMLFSVCNIERLHDGFLSVSQARILMELHTTEWQQQWKILLDLWAAKRIWSTIARAFICIQCVFVACNKKLIHDFLTDLFRMSLSTCMYFPTTCSFSFESPQTHVGKAHKTGTSCHILCLWFRKFTKHNTYRVGQKKPSQQLFLIP